jgi:DNA-binding HxlR family transcriptional regulator
MFMAEWNVFNQHCPTRLVLSRIADKWTVMICLRLAQRTMRFGELRREVAGISQKMLTQSLRALERDGLVVRKVYAEVPARVRPRAAGAGRHAGSGSRHPARVARSVRPGLP